MPRPATLRARAAIELESYREEKVHTNTRKSDFYLEKSGMHAAQHQARAEVASIDLFSGSSNGEKKCDAPESREEGRRGSKRPYSWP